MDSFIAVTDGQLQAVTDKRILALVECKRDQRRRHSSQVELRRLPIWSPGSRNFRTLLRDLGEYHSMCPCGEIYLMEQGELSCRRTDSKSTCQSSNTTGPEKAISTAVRD